MTYQFTFESGANINQIIFHFDPLERNFLKHYKFQIFKFSKKYFQPIKSGYVRRRFCDISYKVSKNLHITLHLRKKPPIRCFKFRGKIVNVQGTFPSNPFTNSFLFRELNSLIDFLLKFFPPNDSQERPLVKLHPDIENPLSSRGLQFKQAGVIFRCFKNGKRINVDVTRFKGEK
jgi:hypothetical protein